MLIHHFLENSAARYPDKIAVIHDSQQASYQQINAQSNRLARHLNDSGISKGDRIVLLLENSIDYITAYYAALKAGGVVAPLNPSQKPDGLQYLLDDLEPSAIITSHKAERLLKAVNLNQPGLKTLMVRSPKQKWGNDGFALISIDEIMSTDRPDNPANPINASDLSSIIYTSGSTGKSKGVMLSHANIVANTNSICQSLNIGSSDVQMVVLPFFYVMGKSLLNTHIAVGGTLVLNNRFMYPADVVHQMIDEQVTSFSGVPSTYAYMLHRSPLVSCRKKLSSLRYCSQAGGHMAKALKLSLRKALPSHTQIYIMYGATEAAARLTCLPSAYFDSKMGSIGLPIPGVTLRVLDERKQEIMNGMEGTLAASGPNIMQGYWKADQDTEQVLGPFGYNTGDIGYKDAEGFFYVTGRKDGLLKVSGHRVNPSEIEDFLIATDLIIEAAVIGIPDQLKGNKLIAVIAPKDDSLFQQSLLEVCAAGLPKHKVPDEILTARILPKNASGKIDRQACIHLALNKPNSRTQ